MVLHLDVLSEAALPELALLLTGGAEGRGEVLARLHTREGQAPLVRLGSDFLLDGELAERLASLEGLANVSLSAKRGAGHLRLVA
jgi:DNA polymerase-3 subunit alpha